MTTATGVPFAAAAAPAMTNQLANTSALPPSLSKQLLRWFG